MKKPLLMVALIVISGGALFAERNDTVQLCDLKKQVLSTPEVIIPFHNDTAVADCFTIVIERPVTSDRELDFTVPESKEISARPVSPVAHAPPYY